MGCIYPYDTLATFQNEIKTELITNRKELLSKFNEPLNSVILNENKDCSNLYSSQIIHINSNIKKYFEIDSSIKNNMNSFVPRLSIQKMNELFDDKDIECYWYRDKPKDLKQFSRSKNKNNNILKINSIEKSLNSTLENTLEKPKKNISNISQLKRIKKKNNNKNIFLNKKNYKSKCKVIQMGLK